VTPHGLLHTLWSQAAYQPGYDKEDWKLVENLLDIRTCFTAEAVQAFDRIVEAAARTATYDEERWTQLAKHFRFEKHLPEVIAIRDGRDMP